MKVELTKEELKIIIRELNFHNTGEILPETSTYYNRLDAIVATLRKVLNAQG